MRAYYDRRAAEYDDWWLGTERERPGWSGEVARLVEHVWMVGDSPTADVHGAEALGLRAILVRGEAVGKAAAAIVAS